jgi:hypothetical protein
MARSGGIWKSRSVACFWFMVYGLWFSGLDRNGGIKKKNVLQRECQV